MRRTLPDGEQETYTYDQYARKATHVDFDGNTATYSYYLSGDPHAGMPYQAVYVGATGSGKPTQTVTYTYDNLGRLSTISDASGTTTNHYDAQGYLTEEDTPEGVIHHVYNNAGQHTQTYTDNTNTLYDYDTQGRLWHVTVTKLNGQTLPTPLVTTYGYDAAGNKTSEVLPNGVTTVYIYDDLNRLTDVVETKGTQTLFSQHYTLRHDGLRSACTETQLQPDGSTLTRNTLWSYDNLGRLTGETVTSSQGGQNYADAFAFDLAGNRMAKTHTGPGGGGSESITYTYNNDDQLTKQLSSLSGETDFAYDANGSQISSMHAGQTTTYTYNVRNKMVGLAVGGVTVATYVYDNAENRVSETTGGVTTLYLTDKDNPTGYAQPVEAKLSPTGAPIETYIIGDRVLGQANSTSTITYLSVDGHGSTRALTSSSGTVATVFNYTGFGDALNFTPAAAGTAILFGGDALYDSASGMYFHGNGVRTRLGFRFLQMDTYAGDKQDPLSLHKYVYVSANPINAWDPSGHFLDTLVSVGIAIGEEAQSLGQAAMYTGLAGFVASALTYMNASLGMMMTDAGDTAGMAYFAGVQQDALYGMYLSGAMFAGGALTYTAGAVLVSVASMAAALGGVNPGPIATLRYGYYEVNGFKFSEYYYNRLWDTGRGAPGVVAQEVLAGSGGSGVPDPDKPGFVRYMYGGWEMVYNPSTKEVWHLQPIW